MSHKLILNRGGEEQVQEFADIEEAFTAAMPLILAGYTARITDKNGVVKYTQAMSNGQITTYPGDATSQTAGSASGQSPAAVPKKPWWRFW